MRRGRKGGLCMLCGAESDGGLYWEPAPITLDLGIPGVPPLEPDLSGPVLCDNCEQFYVVGTDYARDAAFARRVYGAPTAAEALRLLGWQPTPALASALASRRADPAA
jgi:hypothetical protein